MPIIYLARHGQTEYNSQNRLQGHNDSPLTEQGVKQAKELGLKIQGLKFDNVYASDLGRAFITAYLALNAAGLNNPIQTDKRLRELNYGDYNGKLLEDLYLNHPHYLDDISNVYPAGESFEKLLERLSEFWHEQIKTEGTKFFVAHSGASRGLLRIAGIDRYQVKEERMPNAFLARIEITGGKVTDYQEL